MSSPPETKGPLGAPDDKSGAGASTGERSSVRRPTPLAPLAPASPPPPAGGALPSVDKPTLAPARPRTIPKAVLEQQRVIQGARRPGDPPPAPPPPRAAALPKLPKPAPAGPTPLPPGPRGEPAAELGDDLEVDVDQVEERSKIPSERPRAMPKTPPMMLPAICTYGRFEILGRVAFGGMAEIFLGREATAAGASRLLAIKRILPHVADDPQFVEMFLDEARLAIQLNHPFICHIYEFGELEGSYFIAMEWIHGAQLGKMIRKSRQSGGIPPETGAKIIAQVAEALHYAHRARDANGTPLGIVHRDVSPHNVMVSYDGQVKLLDFGIAKAGSHTTKTQAGVIKGKFSYMSPQQCLGKNIDARADVFALGICLYEVLTGETLYHRATEYETMRAVIEDPVPSIRDVKADLPVELDAIVQKALQKKPEDRFRTAGELQGALEDYLARTGRAVTTARIADLMEKLFEDQIAAGPLVDSTPFGQSFRRRAPKGDASSSGVSSGISSPGTGSGIERVGTPSDKPTVADGHSRPRAEAPALGESGLEAAEPAPATGRRWIPLAAAVAGAALLGTVAIVAMSGSEEPAPPAAPTVLASPTTAPAPEPEPAPAPEPVAAPVPAARGIFSIRGVPAGATVRIGDRTLEAAEIGRAVWMDPGTYLVHVEHADVRPFDTEVTVRSGESTDLEPTLVPIPRERAPATPPGHLSINTRPWSKVYVGARLLGTTPIGEAEVPSGNVRLRIVDRDGRTFSRSVRVAAGGSETVFYDLDQP